MTQRSWITSGSALLLFSLAFALQAQAQRPDGPAIATTAPVVRVTTENPREINVGKPATFVFSVANEGTTLASGVYVVLTIPKHVELAKSNITPTKVDEHIYKFQIGDLAAKTTQRLTLVAIPSTTAPIYLDSTVSFATSARAAVMVRRPELSLKAAVPPQAVIGTEVDWTVSVTNTGDGRADDVVVTPHLVAGEVEGKPLARSVKIGSLKPGETKEVQFTVVPSLRGELTAKFDGTNPDGLRAEQESTFRVLQPELSVATSGPGVQPISREGTYEVRVSNPGDAPTDKTMVTVKLPEGLDVTQAAENAYDRDARTLRWLITKVNPGATVSIKFRAEPTAEGQQTMDVIAKSERIAESVTSHITNVISRPNPVVTIMNDQEYAPVGAPTGFRVTVVNAGSKTADALRVRAALPEGLEAVESDKYEVKDGMIEFPALKLESGAKTMLTFQAVGLSVGEHRVRVMVDGVALSRELIFEGSAFCYSTADTTSEARTARRLR
jgi:uncharacterized repeat protein (TIGR01451 family)